MSNNERNESETLNDLKGRLWAKIHVLDTKIQSLDEKSDDYRKALDAYHKIVKAYIDIVKVQHYAPGALVEPPEDDIAKLLKKFVAGEALQESDKKSLQTFKGFLDYVDKVSLSIRKGGD